MAAIPAALLDLGEGPPSPAPFWFAADDLKLHDGYKVGVTSGFPTQAELAVGLRTRF